MGIFQYNKILLTKVRKIEKDPKLDVQKRKSKFEKEL